MRDIDDTKAKTTSELERQQELLKTDWELMEKLIDQAIDVAVGNNGLAASVAHPVFNKWLGQQRTLRNFLESQYQGFSIDLAPDSNAAPVELYLYISWRH